jgi:hypothetical protein
MTKPAVSHMHREHGGWLAVTLRLASAVAALLAGWIAVDVFLTGMATAGSDGGLQFFVFWGIPFATAAVFLGWYAAGAGRQRVRRAARSGCLWAVAVGGAAFIVLFASPLVLTWDALRGAVAAFLYAPLAATVGLAAGLAAHRRRERGS